MTPIITYLLQVLYKYNFELNTLDDVQQSCFVCSILKRAIMHSSCMLNQYWIYDRIKKRVIFKYKKVFDCARQLYNFLNYVWT